MKDIILKLNNKKERLKKFIDKNNIKTDAESNLLSEYYKKIIDKKALLEPITPLITSNESLKETDCKYYYKCLAYKYINNKIEDEK